jgi:propanol-preferring alcohol dehydrogenase
MRAWVVRAPRPAERAPLECVERAVPEPGPGQILVRVEVCGVCRTDLHVAEGDLAPRRPEVVPGHEVVGRVAALGPGVRALREGERVGLAWLARSCGQCRFCARGDENLCLEPRFTGWDVDGGYAEYALAEAGFAYALPESLAAESLAPLLCAGIIGWRAYARSGVRPRGRLGRWGFGGSAHLVLQIARHFENEVYVFSRGGAHRQHALELGATWVGDSFDPSPEPLDAAILFAPLGELVPLALRAVERGGTVVCAGIHMSDIPAFPYRLLWEERVLRSVANLTRKDGEEFLALAPRAKLRTEIESFPLSEANQALARLRAGRIRGAAVLAVA